MFQLTILGTLIGAVLGLRARVTILLPVIGMFEFSVCAMAMLSGQPVMTTILTVISSALAMEAGYLLGSFGRLVTAGARYARRAPAETAPRVAR